VVSTGSTTGAGGLDHRAGGLDKLDHRSGSTTGGLDHQAGGLDRLDHVLAAASAGRCPGALGLVEHNLAQPNGLGGYLDALVLAAELK
jgi:hypothetical protein